MNTKTRNTFRLSPIKLAAAFGLGASLTLTAFADTTASAIPPASALPGDDDMSAVTALWTNTAANLNLSIDSSLYAFGLTAMGLAPPDELSEINDQLKVISGQLNQIDGDIQTLDNDVKAESCNLDLATAVAPAVSHIRAVEQDYSAILYSGGNTTDLQNWLDEVFDPANDGGNSVSQNLMTIYTALMSSGAQNTGVISSCMAAMTQPTAGKLDDRAFYTDVSNLMNYFFTVQTEGMAVEAEAYNYKAYLAWQAANPNVQLNPNQPSAICTNATGEVLTDCERANIAANDIYDQVQDEFAYAGNTLSTSQYQVLNGTSDLFVVSLEDFTAAAGQNCASPLTTTNHCGLTQIQSVDAPTTTAFYKPGQYNVPFQYGDYNQWAPMSTTVMNTVFNGWTNNNQILSDYLTSVGFQNAANKIILTPQTTNLVFRGYSGPSYQGGTADCFADTRLSKSHTSQPFCSNISTSLVQPIQDEAGCGTFQTAYWLPADSTDDAFYGVDYNTGYNVIFEDSEGCKAGYSQLAGYMVNPAPAPINATQSMWPYLDASTLPCTDNVDGTKRSNWNANGIPTQCGTDFDAWFKTIATQPPALPQTATGPGTSSHRKLAHKPFTS